VLLSLFLPLHLHIGAGQPTVTNHPALLTSLLVGLETFLLGPVGFIVEEVFFRGGLDTYLHRAEKGTGWLSAIFVSALWGLWHLPGQVIPAGHLLSTIVVLLVAQIAIGVPLSLGIDMAFSTPIFNSQLEISPKTFSGCEKNKK
jgi:membrane protease YdiL (CAAX protease family)